MELSRDRFIERPVLERMQRAGSRGATVALGLTQEPGRMLSTVQIGITLVGIVAGAFSGATFAERGDAWLESLGMPTRIAEPLAYVVVIAVITYFCVVLGELVPKQPGLRNAERIAVVVSRPMRILATVASPVVGLLAWSARLGLRLTGHGEQSASPVTDEEIRTLMEEAERTGTVEPEERSMIDGVMRLGDRSVRGIMTPRTDLKWIDLHGSEQEVVAALKTAQHERLLAANGSVDDIVSAVPVRRALVALLERDIGEVWRLVEKVHVVSERLSALDAIEQLRQSPLNLVVVVDEQGTVEGIVTEGDVLKTIVADIAEDEGPRIVQRVDGSLLIDGTFPIDQLSDRLGMALPPSQDYHTLAGFILDRLRRLPRIGEYFQHGGWRFEVVDVDGRRIDKVMASRTALLHRGRP
jgi:putative hemolysin